MKKIRALRAPKGGCNHFEKGPQQGLRQRPERPQHRTFTGGMGSRFQIYIDPDGLFVKYVSHTQGKVRADAFRNVIARTASETVTQLEGAALLDDFEFANGYSPDKGYGGEEPCPAPVD